MTVQSVPNPTYFHTAGKLEIPEVTPIYRISFITKTIAPRSLPPFRYMPSHINHDSLEFTAVVLHSTYTQALAAISEFWPDAVPVLVETGHDLDFVSHSMKLSPMGMLPPQPPADTRSRWQRICHAVFSTDPF